VIDLFETNEALVVLLEADGKSELTESLPLHVDAVLADKSHATPAARNAARAATLGVVAVVGIVKLVLGVVSHF